MIYIIDNFLSTIIIDKINEYLVDFKEVDTGHKKFWVMDAEEPFINHITEKISNIEGEKIENIISFFRISTDKLDTDWRIHCDSIINDKIPDRALVLFMNDSANSNLNGTAFWKHEKWGDSLPIEHLSTDVYNDLILNQAEDLSVWELNTIIGHKKNRLISYPCNYFHSKYPNKSWKDGRKVFVMFYKIIK